MKTIKKILVIFVFTMTALCLFACSQKLKYAEVEVEKIAVDGISVTEYTASDELNLNGARLLVTLDNGENLELELTEDMLDKKSFDMDIPGEYDVRIVYGGKSTTFRINVLDWKFLGASLYRKPYVLEYVEGESVDLSGGLIECTFEGDKRKYYEITDDMLEPYNNRTLGNVNINFSYHGVDMSFPVTFVEKTPLAVSIVDSADNNYVFVGFGERYDVTGMTVRVTYDNEETPKYNVKEQIEGDVFVSIDDATARSVDAVLMYYPSDYKDTYYYTYSGTEKVSVGTKVHPGMALASNALVREDGVVVALKDIESKSYGTVVSVRQGNDGKKIMQVSTTTEYALTSVKVKVGDILDDNSYIGDYGGSALYCKGGGIVEAVENGVVYMKTAPTYKFISNVRNKSFKSMTILSYPTPMYFNTDLRHMIEGDELVEKDGKVRVYYDDGTSEVFGMDSNMIDLVNKDKTSVNDVFKLTPGLNVVWVVYGGVLENRAQFETYMEKKYPVKIKIVESTNKISNKTFYFGDTISVSTMSYVVEYNNGTVGEPEALTEDMVEEGSLFCATPANGQALSAKIVFGLPTKYLALIPSKENGEPGDYDRTESTCYYRIEPQPVTSIAFLQEPVKVYVSAVENIDYKGTKLIAYYRNNQNVIIDFEQNADTYIKFLRQVSSWDEIEDYDFNDVDDVSQAQGKRRIYVFTLSGDTQSITDIVAMARRDRKVGYEARVYYFDEYDAHCDEYLPFTYFKIESDYVVSGIKVNTLKDSDGKEYCRREYTQYEAWDLSGLQMNVFYQNGSSKILYGDMEKASYEDDIDLELLLWNEMIYDSSTSVKGSDIPVKFTYFGVTDDNSFSINVIDRVPTDIKLIAQGKTEYISGYNTKMDFSSYTFTISYNGGPTERITGDMLANIPQKEVESGWWYEVFDMDGVKMDRLMQLGKAVFVLHFSYRDDNSEKGYSYISTTDKDDLIDALSQDVDDENANLFVVNVLENVNTVVAVKYEQNVNVNGTIINPTAGELLNEEQGNGVSVYAQFGGRNVLTEVASGWELMLTEYFEGEVMDKLLTVTYRDSAGVESVDYVKITPEMLDYNSTNSTIGYRRVTITYKNMTDEVMIYVWRADLTSVDVAVVPLQNYIYSAINSEEDLDLANGILRLTFSKKTRLGEPFGVMTKYVDMTSHDITYSGFVSGQYSKSGETITINAIYKNYDKPEYTASYDITVYDRQDVEFNYANVIFFYGNASRASFTTKQYISEFTLPEDIVLTYIQTKDLITFEQYAALAASNDPSFIYYVPVTMYDKNYNLSTHMFIKANFGEITYDENSNPENEGDISYKNYIDPAAGSFYVKYGKIGFFRQIDLEQLLDDGYITEEEAEQKLIYAPKFTKNYIENPGDENELEIIWATVREDWTEEALSKISWMEDVVVDKISEEEYALLSDGDKAGYELVRNEYYILMRVNDTRAKRRRYYESTNYALQNYTVIQKVLELVVDEANENSTILRISARINDSENGNPYAIYYLTNPNQEKFNVLPKIFNEIKTQYPAVNYINSVYLASPNENFFEIVVKFNDGYVETDATRDIVATIYFKIMERLLSDDFVDKMGVVFTQINFDYSGKFLNNLFNFNARNLDDMKNKIQQKWYKGVNVFKQSIVDDVSADQTDDLPYWVTYTLTFGDTKTRRGVLQLLSGCLKIVILEGENNTLYYALVTNTLGHSSYTLGISGVNIVKQGNGDNAKLFIRTN